MAEVLIFPTDTPVAETRKAWFRSSGFELKPWPGTEEAAAKAAAVLLVSPVKCGNGQFVWPDSVWKRYLTKINPDTRLIQVGLIREYAGLNYLHWLNPPENFGTFWEASVSVKEMELKPRPGFVALETLWKKFWDGHDKGGFFYYFSQAKMPVQVALDNLIEHPEKYTGQINFLQEIGLEQFLENARKRWAHYLPYWEAALFTDKIKELDGLIGRFAPDWTDQTEGAEFLKKLTDLQERIADAERIFDGIALYFKP